jgi:hypothetical protein
MVAKSGFWFENVELKEEQENRGCLCKSIFVAVDAKTHFSILL